jgi:hypothetical protein
MTLWTDDLIWVAPHLRLQAGFLRQIAKVEKRRVASHRDIVKQPLARSAPLAETTPSVAREATTRWSIARAHARQAGFPARHLSAVREEKWLAEMGTRSGSSKIEELSFP